MIFHGNPQLFGIIGFTLQVAAIATLAATVIGVPIGVALALGRFRGQALAAGPRQRELGLPPVVVGVFLYILLLPHAPFGSLALIWTKRAVFIAQTILALPFTVALSAAAIQALPPGLLVQARLLGAGRLQLSVLAVREARIGVMAGDDRCARHLTVRGRGGRDPRRQHLRL